MKFEDIERLVGQETIANLQGTVASVLETSGGDHDTVRALRKYLVGLLAAIATTKTYFSQSEQFAAEDAVQLNALVRKIKEIAPHQAAKPMPAHVMEPARHAARAVAAEMRAHNVVPFPVSARVPREPEPEPLAGHEFMSHLATVSAAAKRAIARKQELSAQKREVLARSQALLAHSRSLRASLGAAQSGRHF